MNVMRSKDIVIIYRKSNKNRSGTNDTDNKVIHGKRLNERMKYVLCSLDSLKIQFGAVMKAEPHT